MTDSTTAPNGNDDFKEAEKLIGDFKEYLIGETDDQGKLLAPSLRRNWEYLQVYANYGLRLPGTEAALKAALATNSPGSYLWFDNMVESYGGIVKASEFFLNHVFLKVVDLGNHLKNYSDDAGTGQESVFKLVLSLLFPPAGQPEDPETALELLEDMRSQAQANAKEAAAVAANLAEFKTDLIKHENNLKTVKEEVDSDNQVSQETIEKLSGGEDVAGSLAQMRKMLNQDKEEYKHDVTVAATTPTYAWVFLGPIPAGLIAAVTVAAVYGSRATAMLDTIHSLERQISQGEQQLRTAVATQNVTSLAKDSLAETIANTDLAIVKANEVQNQWNNVTSGLDFIRDKIQRTIKPGPDDQDKLAGKALIKRYLNQCIDRWSDIKPIVDAMTTNPFIVVQDGKIDMTDFQKQVEEEIQKQN